MSKENRSASRVAHKKMAKKNAVKFLSGLAGYVTVLVLLFWLMLIIVTSADFYYADAFIPWKPLLRTIMFAAFFILLIAGGYYIAYRFLLKPLEYLDDVTEAARLLASPTDAPVSLPADLKSIEDDLNAVRIQTLESQKAAREAEQRGTGGAGLGPAIAKEIIELHHGIITAYSADEVIRFTIQLPLDCQKIV